MAALTEAGHLRVVINGITIVDEVVEYFKGSQEQRPKNLIGKLNIFKVVQIGYWYQARGKFSNLNVYRSQLSVDAMLQVTSGG